MERAEIIIFLSATLFFPGSLFLKKSYFILFYPIFCVIVPLRFPSFVKREALPTMLHAILLYWNDDNPEAIRFIQENFEEIFGRYITFSNCYLNQLRPGAVLEADAFLVRDESLLQEARAFVDDFSKMIVVNRSPMREALKQISSIPAGSNVLMVNDSYESTLNTIYAFYEIGVSHINLVPYDSALLHTGIYDHIEIAVTPSEPHLVPPHIKTVIDIGYRKVSFDTMFKLMRLLDLDIGIINRNLQRHIHSVVESNEGFHSNYVYGYLKSEMLSTVVNTSENGMLLVDGAFQPVYANRQALKIFHAVNKNYIHITDFISLEALSASEPPDEPVRIGGDEYSIEKNPIRLMDDVVGYNIILQDYTKAQSQKQLHARSGFAAKYTFKDIVSESREMAQVIETARQIASADDTIVLYGESGTGKELFAQSIHNASPRRKGPFIAINCAALPDTLLESELFGYEPGSFTGASSRGRKGLLELAMHGTVFLDEIGEISPKFQASFLRAIQERQVIRVGGKEMIDIDVRFITATNRDLWQKVREGAFRSDLYFRLNVFPLSIPPLRRRRDDLPALMRCFLREAYPGVTKEEFALLNQYEWPGNVRELENACTFYRTMHRFPGYLCTGGGAYPSTVQDGRLELLRLIRKNTGPAHGIGRTNLLYQLRTNNPQLSDHKLRLLLEELREDGLITIRPGRCGAQITEQGISFLQKAGMQ